MIEKDNGFVLRRHNFRETSLISTLYTARFGKIRGIFKGFYTGKREFATSLDNFSLNEFVFYPKKSEIWLVSQADLIADYPFLRSDLVKANTASVIFRLVDKTLQLWDASLQIFNLISVTLDLLSRERDNKVLGIFLIKFLTFSGFKPEFNHCIKCKAALNEEIFFSVARGGLICRECRGRISDARGLSRETTCSLLYIQNSDFELAARLNPSSGCQEEILHILSRFLSYHFEFFDLLGSQKLSLEKKGVLK